MKEIIILFKTHLDVGFTNFAKDVLENYIKSYIPKAIEVATELEGRDERFIWTTGSWLIEQYLRKSDNKDLLIEAIKKGNIRWHGLPFTTHTELLNIELFQYGLNISKKLDEQFNMKTTAAKMTDVPGHTKAIIPYLAKAGIKFLHLGVNPASTPPNVPTLFRWRAAMGEEIVVMYNNNYGDFTEIGNSGVGVYFGHTGDNCGPQSAEAIKELYSSLRKKYPNTKLRAGTLEDVAKVALEVKDIPVITSEIGDTWIHGVGSDAKKVSQFRALLNLKNELSQADMDIIYENLLPIPEHTWGLDEKTHLGEGYDTQSACTGEYNYFIRTEFESVRGTEKFHKMEASWQEQRDYVTGAVDALTGEASIIANEAIKEYKREPHNLSEYTKVYDINNILINNYYVSLNKNGVIYGLSYNGKILADIEHPWGNILYEVFSLNEYDRFIGQYITNRFDWALEDFGKIGIEKAISQHESTVPLLEGVYKKDNELVLVMSMDGNATKLYGAPKRWELTITFLKNEIGFDLGWWEKKANRVAESIWFGIQPFGEVISISKLSQEIDPLDVVDKGNKTLHATDFGAKYGEVTIRCVDSALVNVGKPSLLNFSNITPSATEGLYFNLYNNIWGTNFVMWYDDDARFRFNVRF